MKSALVIEMPSECVECPFHRIYADSKLTETRCILLAKDNEDGVNTRAEWCPLKPMPNKIAERGKWISEEYQKGWNAYREALGETE